MDKIDVLNICKKYLSKIRNSRIDFSEAWLFGSYARDTFNNNSDIDIAIVLNENIQHTFDLEVELMLLRQNEETLIEPHAFSKSEFSLDIPIVNQIIKYGIRIS